MLLNVTQSGDGPPVALLHGLFGRAQNLAPVARHLARDFRVLSLDLRNHGASPHEAGMGYAAMADDVLETLAAARALPAAILGHSMGGKVAMLAALTRPQAVARLIVADIAPVAYRHHNSAVAAALQGLALAPALTRRVADAALAARVPEPAIRGFLLQNLEFGPPPHWKIGLDAIAAGMADIEGWPDSLSAHRYDGPALFVAGGTSDYVREADHATIKALFPRARLAVIPNAGHWLHAEQPEAFSACVAAFLQEETKN